MQDARRFLRYVMPGVVFAIQFGIIIFLVRRDWIYRFFSEVKGDTGISLVITGIFASGGLGVLFSALHHSLRWSRWVSTMDHTGVINRLITHRILTVKDLEIPVKSREQAWVIVTALWHGRLETNHIIKGADAGMNNSVDVMHAMGTMRIAAALGGIIAFLLTFIKGGLAINIQSVSAAAIAFIVICVLHRNYQRTARFAQYLIDQVLTDALVQEKRDAKASLETWPCFGGPQRDRPSKQDKQLAE